MVSPKRRLPHYCMNWSWDFQSQVCKQLIQNAKASRNIFRKLANKRKSLAPAERKGANLRNMRMHLHR